MSLIATVRNRVRAMLIGRMSPNEPSFAAVADCEAGIRSNVLAEGMQHLRLARG
jgi:hypothetical protein